MERNRDGSAAGVSNCRGNPQLAPLFQELQSVSRYLSGLASHTPLPPPPTASQQQKEIYQRNRTEWQARFAAFNDQYEDLEQQIAAGSEAFRQIREPLTVANVQSQLPEGTAYIDLLEYRHSSPRLNESGKLDFEDRYIAFVVRVIKHRR
ncbi:MAG: hypothetical protein R3C28_28630 [Pirellulaceae bacterium]